MSVEYNGTIATGGDSLHDNLNIYYNVSHTKMDPLSSSNRPSELIGILGRRYLLDNHIISPCAAHDSGCWVCITSRRTLFLSTSLTLTV
jgi:hypothetical protein